MALKLVQDVKFTTYAKKVDRNNDRAMDIAAEDMAKNQYQTLRARVKEWTGNLADSITIEKREDERTVGPQGVAYARYIEEGGGGGFQGYHYVRNSTRAVQNKFNRLIKRSLERS